MGIKLNDFIKDPRNVFTKEEAEMIYLASGYYVDSGNEYTGHIEASYELVNKLKKEKNTENHRRQLQKNHNVKEES